MSVSNISSPFKLGWARNRNSYNMSCNSLVSNGTTGTFYLTRSANIPAVGNHVVLAIDHAEYVFTIVSSNPGTYEIATNNDLFNKIRGCWYVTDLFNLPGNNNDATHLCLVGKTAGFHKVEIYCTDAKGEKTGYESAMLTWTLGQNGAGTDAVYYPNYAIAAQLDVVVNNYNELTTHNIKGLVFQPDASGNVRIPLDLLACLIPQPDIPTTDHTVSAWAVLTNMLIKYRLGYGEMWGDTPLIQNWATLPASGYNYALCGEIADRFSRLNLPDWKSDEVQFSETNTMFRIIGEDHGETVRVCISQAEYIYGIWIDPNVSFSNTSTVVLQLSKDDGTATSYNVTVKNGEMYRINVGPAALDNYINAQTPTYRKARYYTVSLSMGGHTWRRTYIVQPDYYGATAMLLQCRYGVLRSVMVPEVRREVVTEADEMSVDRRRYLDITNRGETYTATTAQITRYEARRLSQCLAGEYHYVQCGTNWLRITIEAGSFTVLDDAEDLVRVEFQYRFVENQEENMTDGTMHRATTSTEVDFNNRIISFSQRTTPTNNALL